MIEHTLREENIHLQSQSFINFILYRFGRLMTANNYESMLGMLSTQYGLICFIISINLLFYNIFIGPLIIDELFLVQ